MVSQSQIEFMQAFGELSLLQRRDVAHGVKLARFKKTAQAMLKADPVCANALLGLVACLDHDIEAMHAHHKRAIEISESCFTLIQYAVSLERSCLWGESARFALLALDYDPSNLKILDSLIRLAPLTGRFSLLKRLLPQWRKLNSGQPHQSQYDHEVIADLLARHGLLEKDLKPMITALGDVLSATDIVVQNFSYDIIKGRRDNMFLHFRFQIPEDFVPSYYEDLVDAALQRLSFHPRLPDAFSFSIENSSLYQLYDRMEMEVADAGAIIVPDPEKMKLIAELVEGVEVGSW